jgi:hypothetical protein
MRARILVALLLLSACADGLAARKASLAPLVGQSEADLVRALGVPTRSFESGGHRFLEYEARDVSIIPGLPGHGFGPWGSWGYYGAMPPQVVERVCDTTFDLVNGRVASFTLRGNACD